MLTGTLLGENGWLAGELHIDHARVAALRGEPVPAPLPGQPIIVPGFIDLHVHGGGGADCMEGGAALATMARLHARHGTTALLATTMTAPQADIENALRAIDQAARLPQADGARVLGAHLEGPYINPAKLGAQPDAAVRATLDELRHYLSLATIRVATLAPELDGHLGVIAFLAERGVRVQTGHSLASYEQALAALEHGAGGFTHLYNAMSPLSHRAPGVVGAALAHAEYAEMIPDLTHVHPGALRVALRAIPRLYAVTDGTAACGMPDGDYRLGSQPVHKCLGAVRLADGTLAGSTLTMDQALRNLVGLGLDLAEAVQRLSRYPADYLGLDDRGRLAPGCFADCVVLDDALTVRACLVEGRAVALDA